MLTTETLIQKTPGVIGGDACIRRTRISVWMLVGYKKLGLSDTELREAYPDVTQEDLNAAWEYYRENHAEIEAALCENHNA